MEEYPQFKEERIAKMNPTANIPVVELNGRILTQSYAMLRHFARLLNAYDGKTEDEKYFVDIITDIVIDCKPSKLTTCMRTAADILSRAHSVRDRIPVEKRKGGLSKAPADGPQPLLEGS